MTLLPLIVCVLGPSSWHGVCQTGNRQSPIDIVTKHAAPVKFADLRFHQYNNLLNANNATLHNNGHTVAIEIGSLWNGSTPTVNEGGLESIYSLDHVHFHAKSEHLLNGKRYPLEAHLVHRDHRSSSLSDALKARDGIAVLGVLFHHSDEPNADLQPLAEALKVLNGVAGGRVPLGIKGGAPMPVEALLPQDKTRFFRYYGSLTTPQCHEAVVWTVFEYSIPISKEQLKLFRMPDSNFRPAQSLNRRFVLHNGGWVGKKTTSAASLFCPAPLSILQYLFLSLILRNVVLQ